VAYVFSLQPLTARGVQLAHQRLIQVFPVVVLVTRHCDLFFFVNIPLVLSFVGLEVADFQALAACETVTNRFCGEFKIDALKLLRNSFLQH
jgi:hypothetical protein